MVIEKPLYLLLLLLILPIGGLAIFHYYNGRRDLKQLGGLWRFEALLNVFIVKNFFIFLFFILFVFFTVLALSDIRWDEQLVEDDREGYEIVLLLDISRSMLADDLYPTRLQAAAREISWFCHSLPDAKFSIVIFKGKAVRILPLTDDIHALDLFLNTVSPDLMTVPGSNLDDGIRTALKAFSQAGRYRLIICFTDGENKQGNPIAAARLAGAAGVPVIPVVTGNETGANIRLGTADYLRTEAGKMVISRADIKLLNEIAKTSNGKLYELADFHKIRNELLQLAKFAEPETMDQGLKPVRKEKYELFLIIGILFLTLSVLIKGIRWKKTV